MHAWLPHWKGALYLIYYLFSPISIFWIVPMAVFRISTSDCPKIKTAGLPIGWVIWVTMTNWIVMNIMKMIFQIFHITNNVVPKAFLRKIYWVWNSHFSFVSPREIKFQGMHDLAEICFSLWLDEKMKMIRKNNICKHFKWVAFFCITQGIHQ